MIAGEERAALWTFCGRSGGADRRAVAGDDLVAPSAGGHSGDAHRALRERVRFLDAGQTSSEHAWPPPTCACSRPGGRGARPAICSSALASGVVPIASRLCPSTTNCWATAPAGSTSCPATQTLAAHLSSVLRDPRCARPGSPVARRPRAQLRRRRRRLRANLRGAGRSAATIAGDPRRCVARLGPAPDRRRPPHAHRSLQRLRDPGRGAVARGRARGLGAIAVTDHNEVSGALEARAKAEGIKVIVGEEVKTAEQAR